MLLLSVLTLVSLVAVSAAAVGTADALEQDLALATGGLPLAAVSLLSAFGGAGALLLLVAVSVSVGRRGRWGDLVVGLAAAGMGAALAAVLEWAVSSGSLPRETAGALTRPLTGVSRTSPLSEVVVACLALVTASMPSGRVLRLGSVVVAALCASAFLGGDATAVALVASVLVGWTVGLGCRYGLGRQSTRATPAMLIDELAAAGLAVNTLTPDQAHRPGARQFVAGTPTGPLRVEVFDREQLGSGVIPRLVRLFALRPGGARGPALTLRAQVEHAVLMGSYIAAAGVAAPRPLTVRAVGPESLLVAWAIPAGTALTDKTKPTEPTEPTEPNQLTAGPDERAVALRSLWQLVASLQRAGIAHRGLSADALLVRPDGTAALADVGRGDIAASDLALRLDVAQMLATTAVRWGSAAATRAALAALGADRLVGALPVLQPVALESSSRAELRAQPDLLQGLHQDVLDLVGSPGPVPEVELRRVTARALVSAVGGAVAGYVLVGQLSRIDLRAAFLGIDWAWGSAVVAFSALTFAGAAVALSGAAPARLRFWRTFMTQLAVAFTGLVAPALVGNMALNGRFLRRAGLSAPAAAGAIGLAQVAQFGSYAGLLAISGAAAGIGPRASFTPPFQVVVGLSCVVAGAGVALSVPRIRALVARRFLPSMAEVVPLVLQVAQRPGRLLRLGGGALLLDASFVAALFCATRAAGARTPLAAVAVVYFAGAILGSAVPTPGGLGGIEAALTAGLVAVGTPAGAAVSAVLLYRVATYWLPIPLGWVSIHHLQRIRAL